ncbi:MAG: ribonuclease J [Eubacteriales bacterium]|nr:ribonuclease J [Eubacteriales bacterium]
MSRKERRDKRPGIKVIPLGGMEQIGMNITAFEYDNQIIVVDCGQAFPSDDMPGVDRVIPDISYLVDNAYKVKGLFITHGHEDHIGAIPYFMKKLNIPIYATRLTMAIIENRLAEHRLLDKTKRKVVQYGHSVILRDFRVEFIRSTHSIQDSAMLAIHTPAGTIVHTGDFKVDYTPVFGDPMNLSRLAEIGKKGVLAVMCDSTNVLRPGYTESEKTVGKKLDTIFSENRKRRIIVATFASNVDRVQQIVDMAYKYRRKVFVEGRSMVNIIAVASDLGYLNLHKNVIEPTENMKKYSDEKIVLITTGSQGESMAALSRIAADIHRKVKIKPGDCVVFSSSPIPGNEKSITKVVNELSMAGAKVIVQDTHVSGHACREEIKLIYNLLKPRFVIPAHGEFRHLIEHGRLARTLGYDNKDIFILHSGDVLSLNQKSGKVIGQVPAGGVYVDGLGVGDVGNLVIRDRQRMAEGGVIVIVVGLRRGSNKLVSGPQIVSRGFVFVKESESLMEEARKVSKDICIKLGLDKGRRMEWSVIKNDLRDGLSKFMWKKTKRDPLVIPMIMEV